LTMILIVHKLQRARERISILVQQENTP